VTNLLSSIDKTLETKLLNALVSYFKNEKCKLGMEISGLEIEAICKTLLYSEKDLSCAFDSWPIGEKNILDEYRSEKLEIIDYLHLISTEFRRKFGQYATPVGIVRYILKSVGYVPSSEILDRKLIDPACGSGAFLVESLRIYLQALKKAKTPISKWYSMAISAICGIDIDPVACFFARLNLSMLLAPAILEFVSRHKLEELKPLPIFCADTLQFFASGEKEQTFLYGKANLSPKNRFNFVVGNPPYFKIKELGNELKEVFAESIYGHPNAYALFIQAGIEMLRADGKLGFIVPRSMLSGLYFKNLRNFIERNTAIKEITYISDRKKVFDNVLHGTMILALEQKKQGKEKINISFIESPKSIENQSAAIRIGREEVIQRLNGTTVWFVADSSEVYSVINRIIRQHPLLSGEKINCKAKTGQIVWNRVKPLLSAVPTPDTLPLVWATDVGKFAFSFNMAGTPRPSFLKVNERSEGLIAKGRSILVQRVTADEQPSRIVACIPEEFFKKVRNGYFVENHLNIIQPEANSKVNLYFILGVLNSEIVEFFFRAMNGNTQVSATELNLLPMPIGRYERDIAAIAHRIQTVAEGKRRELLLADLNHLVAKAYGLSKQELGFIKKYVDSRVKRKMNDN
jgi:hypothetical protein